MEINQAIVHLIEKDRNASAKLQLRHATIPVTNRLHHLGEAILKVYNDKTGKIYGTFHDNPASYPFQGFLANYMNGNDSFTSFTHQAMNHLKVIIDRVNFATGGYVLFIHYTQSANDYLFIVILHDTFGAGVDRDTLNLREADHLDISKLHMAARVNYSFIRASEHDVKYLSAVKGRGADDVARYFIEFIGCNDITNPKTQTRNLLQAVKDYCNQRGFGDTDIQKLKKDVFCYCEERRIKGEPVYLESLARHIDPDDPDRFLIIANSEKYAIDDGFNPDREALRRLKYIKYNGDISISFPMEMLGNKVQYKDGILTFLDIPVGLRQQLENDSNERF
ncbi:MAG: nucleoid-associated protein [Magnetococcales bacterium]|nr:nucleoid-associated protein [Magnetococcales bacterium]MBF0322744.1 nucleoid-associated protein [Magnetococcales bacterium]